jgi:hypothetical protein
MSHLEGILTVFKSVVGVPFYTAALYLENPFSEPWDTFLCAPFERLVETHFFSDPLVLKRPKRLT